MTTELIKQKNYLTPYADLKELNFVNSFKGITDGYAKKWRATIMNRVPIVSELKKYIEFKGNLLELGAGSCWFSTELSKIQQVQYIHALDFSKRILREVAPPIMQALRAQKHKITRILGDYHNLPFINSSFDFVVIDAALHHTDYLNVLLKEIRRVLKNDGKVIAIREPITSLFWPMKRKIGLIDKHVKTYGMIENTYDKKTWNQYFYKAGFNLSIRPIFYKGNWKEKLIHTPLFRPFNGILYSRYYFVASKLFKKSTYS